MTATAMIRAYAAARVAEATDGDETPLPLFLAVADATVEGEVRALGHAILCRHTALSDAPYRVGGEMCDPDISAIAAALDYSA